jgi:hypothetical protein
MLVVPLSLMRGKNQFRVAKVTQHLKTNLYVVSRMVEMYKYYIKDACLPTATPTTTTSPNVEGNTVGYDVVSGSNGYIVNIESGGQESK